MSPEEEAAARLNWAIYRVGWSHGYNVSRERQDELLEQIRELEKSVADGRMRLTDGRGRQLVTIDGRYGYAWSGTKPLEVGETVRLPPNWFRRETFTGQVTSLGSDYDGAISEIVRRA
jgi:hypothetical protein